MSKNLYQKNTKEPLQFNTNKEKKNILKDTLQKRCTNGQ